MIFGNLVDCLLFNPDEYEKRYAINPEFNRRSIEGKAAEAEWMKQNEGRVFIENDDKLLADKLVLRLKSHKEASELINSTTSTQDRKTFTDAETGLPIVSVRDGYAEVDRRPIIWDLKTARDASNDGFMRDAGQLGYPLQKHIYCMAEIMTRGVFPEFRFVVVEKTPPYAINVFRPDSRFDEYGKMMYRKSLDRIKFCYENDCFDLDYLFMAPAAYNMLSVSPWLLKNID